MMNMMNSIGLGAAIGIGNRPSLHNNGYIINPAFPILQPQHQVPQHSYSPAYSMLSQSRVKINAPIVESFTLPQEVLSPKLNSDSFEYNFSLELETISKIHDVRKLEAEQKELEAWKALEEKRNRKLSGNGTSTASPDTLVDLNFDSSVNISSPTKEPSKTVTSPKPSTTNPIPISTTNTSSSMTVSPSKEPVRVSTPTKTENLKTIKTNSSLDKVAHVITPQNEQLFLRLVEMGINPEIIPLGMEVVGTENEFKLINFLTEFQQLEELKFPRPLIKQALFMYEADSAKALHFLKECDKLLKRNIKHEQIVDTLSLFNNDIMQASAFLQGYQSLVELGFSDLKIREALVMCNNDGEKAVQYLLENS